MPWPYDGKNDRLPKRTAAPLSCTRLFSLKPGERTDILLSRKEFAHMRIIAGERRGWSLEPPKDAEVSRPISDRVKENLFNILQMKTPDAVVLDVFAGVGSLGLEALSRGARWATFIEQSRDIAAILRRNVEKLKYQRSSRIVQGNSLQLREGIRDTLLAEHPEPLVFDLIFLDPPYRLMEDELCRKMIGETLVQLVSYGAVAADPTIIVRRAAKNEVKYDWPGFYLEDSRRYGTMALDFMARSQRGV
jgi:16S rRNA (guanine(966)-N(2))-methyltransferase RsmD